MCGRVIQSSGPLRYGIVASMDMRDSRGPSILEPIKLAVAAA
jgi:hypothetical protein